MKVLVTGASSGIGFELVKELCQAQHQVFATGRNQAQLSLLQEQTGCDIGCYDLANTSEVLALFEHATNQLGGLEVLINNAGLNTRKCPIDECSVDEFDKQYAVNLRAPAILCRQALPLMKAQGHGHIVNVTSTVTQRSSETMGVYTAMKQGLAGFTGVLIKEAQPFGIKVTNLMPGGTDSNFRAASRPEYMRPSSVAKTVMTLLSLPQDVIVNEMLFRPSIELE